MAIYIQRTIGGRLGRVDNIEIPRKLLHQPLGIWVERASPCGVRIEIKPRTTASESHVNRSGGRFCGPIELLQDRFSDGTRPFCRSGARDRSTQWRRDIKTVTSLRTNRAQDCSRFLPEEPQHLSRLSEWLTPGRTGPPSGPVGCMSHDDRPQWHPSRSGQRCAKPPYTSGAGCFAGADFL